MLLPPQATRHPRGRSLGRAGGFGLLDFALGLALLGVGTVATLLLTGTTRTTEQVQNLVSGVDNVAGTMRRIGRAGGIYLTNPATSYVQQIFGSNAVPYGFSFGAGATSLGTPLSGSLAITGNGDNTFSLILSGLPSQACIAVVSQTRVGAGRGIYAVQVNSATALALNVTTSDSTISNYADNCANSPSGSAGNSVVLTMY